MPGKPEGAETRQRIIGAVWTVTADRGLSAFTVRDVAKQASISHAMVHYHFESKDELILAAVEYAGTTGSTRSRTSCTALVRRRRSSSA